MLFNSYEYLLAFLPILFALFAITRRAAPLAAATGVLLLASLVFYGSWNVAFVPLVLGSITANHVLGGLLARMGDSRRRWGVLACGVMANLALLGYFKYRGFFLESIDPSGALSQGIFATALPLGISFYTFQQIMFLVDLYRRTLEFPSFGRYSLFVLFFPQLVAGPIVHYQELMPQLLRPRIERWAQNGAIGATIIAIGLFKKAVIADHLATISDPVFSIAEHGGTIDLWSAWIATLAFTFQIYFDFSGYSDMAIGSARLFGVNLPANFLSPYKSGSIIDFWRRWHITLSRFLRDYLYIPLGGGRRGPLRRYTNVMVTMLLGGLWHGAGWTFIAWGGLHGALLATNHAWRALLRRHALDAITARAGYRAAAFALTFVAVAVGWVLFRAQTWDAALTMLAAMAGENGAEWATPLSSPDALASAFVNTTTRVATIQNVAILGALIASAWTLPNTSELFADHLGDSTKTVDGVRSESAGLLRWETSPAWAAFTVALILCGFYGMLSGGAEFLYWEF